MKFLTTVRHTGTTYFQKGFEANLKKGTFNLKHVSEELLKEIQPDWELYTTYRNPYRVAASWANRNMFYNPEGLIFWKDSWEAYRKLLYLNPTVLDVTKGQVFEGIDFGSKPLNKFGDAYQLHKSLDKGETERLYQFIPKALIIHAIECCGDLYKQ